MPNDHRQGRHDGAEPRPDAVERLYAYWIASCVLLLLIAVVPWVLLYATTQRQTAAIETLSRRIADLERAAPNQSSAVPPNQPATNQPDGESPTNPRVANPSDSASFRDPDSSAASPSPLKAAPVQPAAEPKVPSEAEIERKLNAALLTNLADVADPAAADAAILLGKERIGRPGLAGSTWARLALVARLQGRDTLANAFARRAEAAGANLAAYNEVSARILLLGGSADEAAAFAERALKANANRAGARILMAACLLARGAYGPADELLANRPEDAELPVAERLILGRALLILDYYDRLAQCLISLRDVPPALAAERDFLRAAVFAQTKRTTEALAMLDFLAAHPVDPLDSSNPVTSGDAPAATVSGEPRPTAYDIALWRGITLLLANQPDAAREALEAATKLNPGRPEGLYWRGMVELRNGRSDVAKIWLQNAVATLAGFVPAWEALGILELNSGNSAVALEQFTQALQRNPRRASSQFLSAVTRAKLGQRDEAIAALQLALQLRPEYLNEATQTDALLKLLTAEEMGALAAAPGAPAPSDEPSDP